MGKNRQPPAKNQSTRYPGHNQPGRKQMPQRSASQQARLWALSLCAAVPGAAMVHFTGSYWIGAATFLLVVLVLGFILYQYEKRKQQ